MRNMVGRWGMSEAIGPIAVLPVDEHGRWPLGAGETSETTQRVVDEEVRRIVEDARAHVTELLTANREKLEALVTALLDRETLDQDEAYAAAGIAPERARDTAGTT